MADNIRKIDLVDIDLNTGNIHRSFLNHAIGMADNVADGFGVRLFRNGAPVDATGAVVQGFFRNPHGENIAITSGNYLEYNTVYVILPQACYNYEGQFTLAIKVIGGGVTGTMRIVDGVVDNTNTSEAVAPTGMVPTYQEILAVYESMLDALDDAAAWEANFAPEFLPGTENAAGSYVMYDGELYYLPNGHEAGTLWGDTVKEKRNIGEEMFKVDAYVDKIDPLSRYRIEGVSVSNIANPINPAYGGNIIEGSYLTGYGSSGIEFDYSEQMMTIGIPIAGKVKLTFPKDGSNLPNHQYLIIGDGLDSQEHGYKNIHYSDVSSYTGQLYPWIYVDTDRCVVDCEGILKQYPDAVCVYVSCNAEDALKYCYDNNYSGDFISYDGNTKKTISWLDMNAELDPLSKYKIEGVNVSNVANPKNPAYGGNIIGGTYLTGYDGSGITFGYSEQMMTIGIPIEGKYKLTFPKNGSNYPAHQYLIVGDGLDSQAHGYKNIQYSDISNYTGQFNEWLTVYSDRCVVNCEYLLKEYPQAECVYVSCNASDNLKYCYDSDYSGVFIAYDGEEKKTISWLMTKDINPLSKYRIEGVSISNIANPSNPYYGGNIIESSYLMGYDDNGLRWGMDDGMMTIAVDTGDVLKMTLPKNGSNVLNHQYIIIADSVELQEHGYKNIHYSEIASYIGKFNSWLTVYEDRCVIDCERLHEEYPSAEGVFVSCNKSGDLKYCYDSEYFGSYIAYDGTGKKKIDWLDTGSESSVFVGKRVCTYGDSLMNQNKTIENGDTALNLSDRICGILGADLYDRAFPGASVSAKTQANIAWIQDSAVTNKASLVLYRANPESSQTPPSGVSVINNDFYQNDRIATVPTDSDIILIMGGINDVEFKGSNVIVTEDVNQGDSSYFTYAYARTIERLQTRCPNALIFLVIEPWCYSIGSDQTKKAVYEEVVENIEWLGKYYHIPVLNLYDESNFNSMTRNLYIKQDGTHPTTNGDILLANRIAGFIKRFW